MLATTKLSRNKAKIAQATTATIAAPAENTSSPSFVLSEIRHCFPPAPSCSPNVARLQPRVEMERQRGRLPTNPCSGQVVGAAVRRSRPLC